MHSLDVHFELLGLTEFTTTKVAQRSSSLWVGTASVGPVHFQVVQPEKVFLAELALVRSLSLVLFRRVQHYIVLAQHGQPTDLAVILSDGQTEGRIMKHGAVCAIIQRMLKL